jgi:hypothetical protein
MGAESTGEALCTLYWSETIADLRREVLAALLVQRNTAGLTALARDEADPARKKDIVAKLTQLHAADAAIELLK